MSNSTYNYLDANVVVYNGRSLNAAVIAIADADSLQFEDDMFGGLGQGSFSLRHPIEHPQTKDMLAPNRVEFYLRQGQLAQGVSPGSSTITVFASAGFQVGQKISLYDGIYNDLVTITGINPATNVLSVSPNIGNPHGEFCTVMVCRYMGMINQRVLDINLNPNQTIKTMGYSNQMMGFYEQKFDCGGREVGWLLFNYLSGRLGDMNITLDATNWVMDSTGLGTGGTGVQYQATYPLTQSSSILNDLVNMANSNSNQYVYRLWVDASAVCHFEQVPTVTPTISVDLVTNQWSGLPQGQDGLYDSIGGNQITDQDTTQMATSYIVQGGTDPSTGQQIQIIVNDPLAEQVYGEIDQIITNQYIYNQTSLEAWAQQEIEEKAFPATTTSTTFITTGSFATCSDFVEITGYTDGSSQTITPFTIVTQWQASDFGQFQQSISGEQIHPNVNALMAEIAGQTYNATINYGTSQLSNLGDRFVQSGCGLTFTSTTATLSTGYVVAKVNI